MATNDHQCLLHNIMVCKIDGFYIFSSKSWIYLYFSHIMFCTLSNIGSFRNPFPFRSENSERSPKFWDFHFRHVGRSLPHSGADCKRLQSFLPIGPFVDRWAAKLEMKWVCRRKRNTEMIIVHIIHKVNRCLARYSPRATTTNRHQMSQQGLAQHANFKPNLDVFTWEIKSLAKLLFMHRI